MLKNILFISMLIFILFLTTGCSSFPFFYRGTVNENESEIIINCGSTIYYGRYDIYLNGESRKSVSNKGGMVKYTVPDGYHVIMVSWKDNYGVSTDITSIQVRAESSRIFLFVSKTRAHEDMEITLVDVVELQHKKTN